MDIFLVRHAKSAHDYTRWKTDGERPLADIGRDRQTKSAKGMLKLELHYTDAWVSPFLRAQQTLQIIQDVYNTKIEPKIIDELKVWGNPSEVMQELEAYYPGHENQTLIVVGHNPNMSNLVDLLTDEDIYMSTSDLVHINYNGEEFNLIQYYPRKELMDQ